MSYRFALNVKITNHRNNILPYDVPYILYNIIYRTDIVMPNYILETTYIQLYLFDINTNQIGRIALSFLQVVHK
jgi:hypothetical protein